MDKKLRFDFAVTQKIITRIGSIDAFKGKWLATEKQENRYLSELRKIATIQSIGSSTRIEGATLTNEEVETLIRNLMVDNLESRDEQEVVGYFEVLETILENFDHIELTEGNILNLHNLLLKFSGKDQSHKGSYKQLSNQVVATYPGGSQRIIFNTTAPYLVKKEMEDLVVWTNKGFNEGNIHPLILIGAFIYEFLSIHPFQDGNGRLSRLLTTLLLLRQDYDFVQYVSFENEIERRKKTYYRALMEAQQKRNTEAEIIDAWMLFFLDCMEALIVKLESKYEQYKAKGPYLNERQKKIIGFLKENEPLKIGDLAGFLEDESRSTLKNDLLYLNKEGVIDKLGRGKGTIYVMRPKEEEE